MEQKPSSHVEPAGLQEPDQVIGSAEAVPEAASAKIDQLSQELKQVRRRQKRWLVGCGILIPSILLLGLVGFFVFIQKGVTEVRAMGPWPDPAVPLEKLVTVDLSQLGLKASQLQSARDREEWSGGGYDDGVVAEYESGEKSVAYIWMLRYGNEQAAGNDYRSIQSWAGITGNCGRSIYAYYGSSGVVHCQYSNAFIKTFWNNRWIVQIVALDGSNLSPVVLIDKVRDAVAAHWKAIAAP